MIIHSLSLENYRNYEGCQLEFHPKHNLFYGENAQGKTNLLEAIAYLSSLRSHRTQSAKELTLFGQSSSRIVGKVDSREREFTLEVSLINGAPSLKINDIRKKRREIEDVFYTVLFCPEDLSLIKSVSAERRKFLDTTISQLRPNYGRALSNYQRLYKSKVRILKDWRENPSLLDTLDDFNHQLTLCGVDLIHYRAHFLKRLQSITPSILLEFSNGRDELELLYHTVSTISDPLASREILLEQMMEHQKSHREAEIASSSCLSGPHKDDFFATINGQDVRKYGSQGQCRTLAISLKLAQRELYFQEVGEYPVLLLDDVLSELDEKRQEYLLNKVQNGQIFITSCQQHEKSEEGAIFYIEGGTVTGIRN
ncbi:MAG: DNA replication/repair protein RecF [Eubacteriales bacterium]